MKKFYRFCIRLGSFLVFMLGLIAFIFGFAAFNSSRTSHEMSLRTELYNNERWWYDRCAAKPELYAYLVRPGDVSAEEYVNICIDTASSTSGTYRPKNVDELDVILWGKDNFHDKSKQQLRQIFDIFDVAFYHNERIFRYTGGADGVLAFLKVDGKPMTSDEAQLWLGMLYNIGPNPLLLGVIKEAHDTNYIDYKCAEWIQKTMKSHERVDVVEYFYPDLLKKEWLSAFGEKDKRNHVDPDTSGWEKRLKSNPQ